MTTPFEITGSRLTVPIGEGDHFRGPARAPVTLVEYGDFQCPFCGAAYPVLQALLSARPALVRLVYRHFPITNLHPYAELAAEAAEAADVRQAFWPMHDWLFANQDHLAPPSILAGVEENGLPVGEVENEIRAQVYLDRIRRDFVGGVRSGVNGTPALFINGVRHDGGRTLPDLLSAVDEAAAAVGSER